ncbi:unnamed protein product, partial [Mesorhabditis spiculigera]
MALLLLLFAALHVGVHGANGANGTNGTTVNATAISANGEPSQSFENGRNCSDDELGRRPRPRNCTGPPMCMIGLAEQRSDCVPLRENCTAEELEMYLCLVPSYPLDPGDNMVVQILATSFVVMSLVAFLIFLFVSCYYLNVEELDSNGRHKSVAPRQQQSDASGQQPADV